MRPVHVEYLLMLIPTTSTLSLLIATKKHTCLQMTLELTFGTWRSQTKASVSLFINGIAHPSLNADLILKFHDMTITLLQVSTFLYFFYLLLRLAIFFETWWAINELQPEEHCNLNWTTRHKIVLIALNIKQNLKNLWPF